jgi:hypothetical protein
LFYIQGKMNGVNKFLVVLSLSGVIIVSVSAFYIPSVGGTIPLGMNPQEFQKQQNEVMYASIPFKIMMGGAGLAASSLLCVYIRIAREERREIRKYLQSSLGNTSVEVKPILKITRIAVEPMKEEVIPVKEVVPVRQVVPVKYIIPRPLVLPPVRPPYMGNPAIYSLPMPNIRRYNVRPPYKYVR